MAHKHGWHNALKGDTVKASSINKSEFALKSLWLFVYYVCIMKVWMTVLLLEGFSINLWKFKDSKVWFLLS